MKPDTWTDDRGVSHYLVTSRQSLNFKLPLHAALRAYVFRRDGYKCQRCRAVVSPIPSDYTGRYTLNVRRDNTLDYLVLDHVKPREFGGSSHPDNLQTLCARCNVVKRQTREDFRYRKPGKTGA